MKRNKERVPEFDEIIFANRNRNYGAYNLRKRYNSTASLSILGGVSIGVILVIALSLNTKPATAITGPGTVTVQFIDPVKPEYVKPPEIKPPDAMINQVKNLKPVVTDDTSKVTPYLPTVDDLLTQKLDGDPTDSITVVATIVDPVIPVKPEPAVRVEEMPEFPGGMDALMKYVGENVKYPSEAERNGIQGRVFLKFVVNADGTVDRIEVLKSIDPLLDNEAIRVVSKLPKFKPGKQNGVAVPVWFCLPITFKIQTN